MTRMLSEVYSSMIDIYMYIDTSLSSLFSFISYACNDEHQTMEIIWNLLLNHSQLNSTQLYSIQFISLLLCVHLIGFRSKINSTQSFHTVFFFSSILLSQKSYEFVLQIDLSLIYLTDVRYSFRLS